MSPELEFVRRETERTMQAAPPDALLRAPAEKWNSLQIIEHLFLSYTATTKGLLRKMEEGQPEQTRPDVRQRLRSLYVLKAGRFPAGIESPKQTTPRASLGNEPLRHFNDALVAMDATLADAEKRFGARTRVLNHPILGPLTAQQWRRFHQVHGRHHLKQIAARVSGQE
ncbi:MAG TPA: DUF1569 domain-containing protein [Candidatus Sulfotelmatobacter sp.]|nr:DUF1569 domain-containing protein [Candidatus Sulfotelmatobacter sp.]